jgi:4'-phosphopantetheinyl transferase
MPAVECNSIDNISWNAPSPGSFLLDGAVHIWRIRVSSNIHRIDYFRDVLTADELEKALRYHQEKDRHRSIISGAAARLLLGKYLDQSPQAVQLATGINKKPFVQHTGAIDLHYNTTHAGDWILIAIAGKEVGVDVERIEKNFMYSEVLQLYFSPQEIDFIKKTKQPIASFFSLWTRKEVLLKATAKGLDDDLPGIPCLDGIHAVDPKVIGSAVAWKVNSFEFEEEYMGSIAYNPLIQHTRFWDMGVD